AARGRGFARSRRRPGLPSRAGRHGFALGLDVDGVGFLLVAGAAPDPARAIAGADLHAPGLGILALRELDLEQAVLEVRLDSLPVHVVGQAEAAEELAVSAL